MALARNISIYAFADILGAGIGLITSPISTRLLTQEQYGAIPLLSAVWAVVALFQYAGMDSAFPFFRTQQNQNYKKVLVTATILASAGGVILWTLFSLVNMLTPWLRQYTQVSTLELSLFLAMILPGTLINWYLYILRYEKQAMAFARISLFGRTLGALLALPAMVFVSQEWRLAVGFGIGSFISVLAIFWALIELRKLKLHLYDTHYWSLSNAKPMLRYGLLLVPGGAVYAATTVVDRLLVGWYIGPEGNALLALTSAVGGVALLLKLWFARAWDPHMIDWLKTKDPTIYMPRLQMGINVLLLTMLPLPILATLWIGPVISLLYPQQYAPVISFIPPLILSGVISTFSLIAVASVLIADTPKWHFPLYLVAFFVNLIIGIFTIPSLGILGAILGTLLSEVLILVMWICIGKLVYQNLYLKWWPCLILLSIASLFSFLYSPGIISVDFPTIEKLVISVLLTLAWVLGWSMMQPLQTIRQLNDIKE